MTGWALMRGRPGVPGLGNPRIVEPTSKLDSLRVLADLGAELVSYKTIDRRIRMIESWWLPQCGSREVLLLRHRLPRAQRSRFPQGCGLDIQRASTSLGMKRKSLTE